MGRGPAKAIQGPCLSSEGKMAQRIIILAVIGSLNFNYRLLMKKEYVCYFFTWFLNMVISLATATVVVCLMELPLDGPIPSFCGGALIIQIFFLWPACYILDLFVINAAGGRIVGRGRISSFLPIWFLSAILIVTLLSDWNFKRVEQAEIAHNLTIEDMSPSEAFPGRLENTMGPEAARGIAIDMVHSSPYFMATHMVQQVFAQAVEGRVVWRGIPLIGSSKEKAKGYVSVEAMTGEASFHEALMAISTPSAARTAIYRSGKALAKIDKPMFALDPDGRPVWTAFLTKATRAIWVRLPSGLAIVDASSKEVSVYGTDGIPEWVSVAFSQEYADMAFRAWCKAARSEMKSSIGLYYNGRRMAYAFEALDKAANGLVALVSMDARTGSISVFKGLVRIDNVGACKIVGMMVSKGGGLEGEPGRLCPVVANAGSGPVLMWLGSMGEKSPRFVLVGSKPSSYSSIFSAGDSLEGLFDSYIAAQEETRAATGLE